MYRFARKGPIDLDELRQRLHAMTDIQLISYGRSCRHMASPQASWGAKLDDTQLRECIAEWRRRYPTPLDRQALRRLRERAENPAISLAELDADWPR